jgi:hypothetical protein
MEDEWKFGCTFCSSSCTEKELCGLSTRENYTDRATAAS